MVFVGYGLSVQVNTGKNGNEISLILEISCLCVV